MKGFVVLAVAGAIASFFRGLPRERLQDGSGEPLAQSAAVTKRHIPLSEGAGCDAAQPEGRSRQGQLRLPARAQSRADRGDVQRVPEPRQERSQHGSGERASDRPGRAAHRDRSAAERLARALRDACGSRRRRGLHEGRERPGPAAHLRRGERVPDRAEDPVALLCGPPGEGAGVWATGPAGSSLGEHSTVAIIDTGIDYTHADFGGPGTPADYQTALADDTSAPTYPDPNKISARAPTSPATRTTRATRAPRPRLPTTTRSTATAMAPTSRGSSPATARTPAARSTRVATRPWAA